MTILELRTPLTKDERGRLARYLRQRRAFARLPETPCTGVDELTAGGRDDYESADMQKLLTRRDQEHSLRRLSGGLRLLTLEPLLAFQFAGLEKANAPALIAEYEKQRRWCETSDELQEHNAFFLRGLTREGVRATLADRYDRYNEKDAETHKLIDLAAGRVVTTVTEHIKSRTAGSGVGDPATNWKSLQPAPASNFTLASLDALLVSCGLLSNAASRTPTDDFRGAALVGIVEALRERKYLKRSNTAKLVALLAERYGRDVANPNTTGRNYDPLPASAQVVYTRALALLPAL